MENTENENTPAGAPSALNGGLGRSRVRLYSQRWDAYYWSDNGQWDEKRCSDPTCEFCANRPDSAFEVPNVEVRSRPTDELSTEQKA